MPDDFNFKFKQLTREQLEFADAEVDRDFYDSLVAGLTDQGGIKAEDYLEPESAEKLNRAIKVVMWFWEGLTDLTFEAGI